MQFSWVNIWSILVIWVVLNSVNLKPSDSNDDPICPTCAEAKPLVTKYKYVTRSDCSKSDPVAILLAFNSNVKAKKAKLNDLLSETDDSDESIEIPIRTHGGKVSRHSSKALRKLLRPLIENGELESTSTEEQVLDEWQCKRDELVNLLRIVLKKKQQLLENKHGIIDSVLSDEDKLVVVSPPKKPVVPVVTPPPVSVPVVVPVVKPVAAPIPVAKPEPNEPHKDESPSSFLSELKELLGHLPQCVRDKVSAGIEKMLEKINSTKLSDLKSTVKGVALDLLKDLVTPSSSKEEDDSDEKKDVMKDVAVNVGTSVVETVIETAVKKEDDDNSKEDTEKESLIKKEDIKDLIVNFNSKVLKEKLLQLIKRIIEQLAEEGLDALHDLVGKLLQDFVKDLLETSDKIEKFKPILKQIGEKIIQGIKDIVEIAGDIEGDTLKEKVKTIIGKIIDEILECLYPDDDSSSTESSEEKGPSKTSKKLITKALLAVVDKVFEELTEKKNTSEESSNSVEDSKPIFASIGEILDRLKQIPEIIEQKLLEGVKKIIGEIGKDQGPNLEELVEEIVEDILLGILSPDKPLPEPVRVLLKPVTEKISDILCDAVKEIITEVANKKFEGLEEVVNGIVSNLLKDVIDFITGKEDISDESEESKPSHVLPALGKIIPDKLQPIVVKVVDNLLDKLLHKDHEESSKSEEYCDEEEDEHKPSINDILKIGEIILKGLKSIVEKIGTEELKDLGESVVQILSTIPDQKIKPFIEPILEKLREKLQDCLKNVLKLVLEEGLEGLGDKLKSILCDLLKEILNPLVSSGCKSSGDNSPTEEVIEKLLPIIGDLVELLSKGLKDKVNAVKELLYIGKSDDEEVDESASHISETIENKPSSEETKEDPIPEGLISDGLVPVITKIVNVLDIGGEKNNKRLIKDITDELLNKLLSLAPEKTHGDSHSEYFDDDHKDTFSVEEHHLDEIPKTHSLETKKEHEYVPEKVLDDATALISVKKEELPEVVVLPTETDGTYRVSLNIDKLVDKEFKKFKNLKCKCMEGPIADERCPLHNISKDDIKESLKGKFFRKLIKAVPIADEKLTAGSKIVSNVVKQVVEKAHERISDGLKKDHVDDHDESEESEESAEKKAGKEIVKKVVEKVGDKAIRSVVEKIFSKLGKDKDDQKKHIMQAIQKVIAKLSESKSEDDDKTVESKNEKVKEFLSELMSELIGNDSKDSRHKRQFDIDPVSSVQNDDCPTCLKPMNKRNTPKFETEKPQEIVCHHQLEALDMEEHSRVKRQNDENVSLRMERAIGNGCLPCGSFTMNENVGFNSTYYYMREPKRERITRDDSSVMPSTEEHDQANNSKGPLRLTLKDDFVLG